MNRVSMVALTFVLITENAFIYFIGSSHIVSNVACVVAFAFFVSSLLPTSSLGFALTLRDWGDVFRRELLGTVPTSTDSETRWAATKSLAILSMFVVLGFIFLVVRSDIGERPFMTDLSVLVGMESGFLAGYLMVSRRRI